MKIEEFYKADLSRKFKYLGKHNILREVGVEGGDLRASVESRLHETSYSSDTELVYTTLSGIVASANQNATMLVLDELRKILEYRSIDKNMNTVSPYLYTVGFLAFAGRAINKENMDSVLRAIGVEPGEGAEKILLATKVRNNIVYLYAAYYLMVMGREVSRENMFKILKALNEPVDEEAAADVLALYAKRIIP